MTLESLAIAVVALDRTACERKVSALAARGAKAQGFVVDEDPPSAFTAGSFEALVLVVGSEPERFIATSAALQASRIVPRMTTFVVADPSVRIERVALLGPHVVVLDETDDTQLIAAIPEAVGIRRAGALATQRARSLEARLRTMLTQNGEVRRQGSALNHDARVLFGVVIGFASNLRDGFAGPLDATQQRHVNSILEASTDASALVDRYAALARALPIESVDDVEASIAAVPRTPLRSVTDIGALVRTTALLFEAIAEEKKITLAVAIESPPNIWCDAMQIKQLVTNLIVNALKFTPVGGTVSVTARSTAPSEKEGSKARRDAEVVVRDTGPGIAPEHRDRVFVRGVRLERDAQIPGTGIGLAVVKEVVEQHGGSVRIEESEGGGTAVFVALPTDRRRRRQADSKAPDPRQSPRKSDAPKVANPRKASGFHSRTSGGSE